MAQEVIEKGTKIGVVATLNTTLNPNSRLIQKMADEKGKNITLVPRLAEGAFDLVSKGDREGHNKLVIKTIQELDDSVDVIAPAQGSIVVIIPDLKGVNTLYYIVRNLAC